MSKLSTMRQLRRSGIKGQVGTLAADRHRPNPRNRIGKATSGTTFLPIIGKDKLGQPVLGPEESRQTRPWKTTEHNGQTFGLSTPARFGNSRAR